MSQAHTLHQQKPGHNPKVLATAHPQFLRVPKSSWAISTQLM